MSRDYQIRTNGELIITVTGGIIANKVFKNAVSEGKYSNLELVMIDIDHDDCDNEILTERLIKKYEDGEITTVDWVLDSAYLHTDGAAYCAVNSQRAVSFC